MVIQLECKLHSSWIMSDTEHLVSGFQGPSLKKRMSSSSSSSISLSFLRSALIHKARSDGQGETNENILKKLKTGPMLFSPG
mmetsp:Transcript_12506/g.16737  ORF Transcript_12506/g.16737 Transcript_12506/m.16737 type:complete len:82 (+) Transcript_12506:2597-2842(+)